MHCSWHRGENLMHEGKKSRSMGLRRHMLTMQESMEEKTDEKQREGKKAGKNRAKAASRQGKTSGIMRRKPMHSDTEACYIRSNQVDMCLNLTHCSIYISALHRRKSLLLLYLLLSIRTATV